MDSNNPTPPGGVTLPPQAGAAPVMPPSPSSLPLPPQPSMTSPTPPSQIPPQAPSSPAHAETTFMPGGGSDSSKGGKGKMMMIIALVLVVLTLVGGGGYYYMQTMNKPTDVADTPKAVDTSEINGLNDDLNTVDLGNLDSDFADVDSELSEL